MPRLETQKVPPVNSAGESFFSRARLPRALASELMAKMDFQVGVAHDRRDQAVLDRDGERDMSRRVVADRGLLPGTVDGGHRSQGLGAGLEHEVVDRELHALLLQCGIELRAELEERTSVDLDVQVEVRDLGL